MLLIMKKLIVTSLLAIFSLPIILSGVFYLHPNWLIGKTSNKGYLLTSHANLADQHTGKWLLALFYPAPCKQTCKNTLKQYQQIIKATGKNQLRVNSFIISKSEAVNLEKIKLPFALKNGTTFLIDPLGNIVMAYPPKTKSMNILKDLKRLLRVSQIG